MTELPTPLTLVQDMQDIYAHFKSIEFLDLTPFTYLEVNGDVAEIYLNVDFVSVQRARAILALFNEAILSQPTSVYWEYCPYEMAWVETDTYARVTLHYKLCFEPDDIEDQDQLNESDVLMAEFEWASSTPVKDRPGGNSSQS